MNYHHKIGPHDKDLISEKHGPAQENGDPDTLTPDLSLRLVFP